MGPEGRIGNGRHYLSVPTSTTAPTAPAQVLQSPFDPRPPRINSPNYNMVQRREGLYPVIPLRRPRTPVNPDAMQASGSSMFVSGPEHEDSRFDNSGMPPPVIPEIFVQSATPSSTQQPGLDSPLGSSPLTSPPGDSPESEPMDLDSPGTKIAAHDDDNTHFDLKQWVDIPSD